MLCIFTCEHSSFITVLGRTLELLYLHSNFLICCWREHILVRTVDVAWLRAYLLSWRSDLCLSPLCFGPCGCVLYNCVIHSFCVWSVTQVASVCWTSHKWFICCPNFPVSKGGNMKAVCLWYQSLQPRWLCPTEPHELCGVMASAEILTFLAYVLDVTFSFSYHMIYIPCYLLSSTRIILNIFINLISSSFLLCLTCLYNAYMPFLQNNSLEWLLRLPWSSLRSCLGQPLISHLISWWGAGVRCNCHLYFEAPCVLEGTH